jgi:hypothetical protein
LAQAFISLNFVSSIGLFAVDVEVTAFAGNCSQGKDRE